MEVYQVFGIEAARLSLLKEMRRVIELGGSYANYRYLGLLVDIMTIHSKLMAITCHDINHTNQAWCSDALVVRRDGEDLDRGCCYGRCG